MRYFFRCASDNHPSAIATSLKTHIYDIVSHLDDIQIVLYHNHRITTIDKAAKNIEQYADIFEMQTGRRLVKDIYSLTSVALGQLGGKFHSLTLTARERGRALPQFDIAQSDVVCWVRLQRTPQPD